MKRRHLLIGLAWLAGVTTAFAQTGAFTYQGRLAEMGQPANGVYDIAFRLYDAGLAGRQVGGEVSHAGLAVSNGMFAVELDFGARAFDGDPRWLEIDVRRQGAHAFTTLRPRQPVNPVPYAIMAGDLSRTLGTDDFEDDSVTSLKIQDGAIASRDLSSGSVTAGKIAAGAIVNADIAADARIVDTKLATLDTPGKVHNRATSATGENTPNTIVQRDANGDFSAREISATKFTGASFSGASLSVGGVSATSLSGGGAGLTGLNAEALATGTIPDARLAASVTRDNEILPTLLANDGPGSGLNADLVDGFQADDFAATVHVHYGANWGGASATGLGIATSAGTGNGVAAVRGRQGAGVGLLFSTPAGVWGDSEDGYGVLGSTADGTAGVFGRSVGIAGSGDGVRGWSDGNTGHGVYGRADAESGVNYGVYGKSDSPDGFGVYAHGDPNGVALKAGGSGIIQSTANSYLFVSGNAVVEGTGNPNIFYRIDPTGGGGAKISRPDLSPGASTQGPFYLPVAIPAIFYGQPVRLESITVHYQCENSPSSFIETTFLNKQTDAGSSVVVALDGTDRTSTTPSSYTLNIASNNVFSVDQGILAVGFTLSFSDPDDTIVIGGVRLKLSHQ